jgi:glucokinase
MNNSDLLCTKVLDFFIEILELVLGNVALKALPYGGIYLVEGVSI